MAYLDSENLKKKKKKKFGLVIHSQIRIILSFQATFTSNL